MSAILVTGGTGFLGQHVVKFLLDRDSQSVRVLSTGPRDRFPFEVDWVQGDITSPEVVARAVSGSRRIFHLAGKVSRKHEDQRALYEVHVEGTRALCRAARGAGVERIVLASTSGTLAVSSDGKSLPDETAAPPLQLFTKWPYYASKYYQEKTAIQECEGGPELVILHPSLLLGPGDARLSSTADVLKFMGKEIAAIPPGGLNFVDVRDAAQAFLEAMERGRSGERYLLGAHNWTFEKFFGRLERLTKVKGPMLRAPGKLIEWTARTVDALYQHWGKAPPVDKVSLEMSCYFWYLDASKAKRELGFETRAADETLFDTVAYLEANFLGKEAFRQE
jgi:dihydroflavonol-4-reductase